jgi:antitoxin component YwqK of YwqJK toxin-antitoxin module
MFRLFSFLILTYFLVTTQSCIPQKNQDEKLMSINLIDREGLSETISNDERLKKYEAIDFLSSQPYQKVLRVYNRNACGEMPAYVTSYHANGQLKQYLEIVNGRAFGTYREWYSNSNLKVQATIIGGEADITMAAEKTWLFDGLSQAWDEDGNLEAQIPYERGVLQGVSTYYHPNGTIWKTVPFVNDQIQGLYSIYLNDESLLSTAEYKNGVQQGAAIRYWKNDLIASEETYCDGLLMQGKYYDPCKELVSEVNDGSGFRALFSRTGVAELQEYRHGSLEGEVRLFDSKGLLMRIYHIKKALKNGEEIDFYKKIDRSGKRLPKISVNWVDDKIQGLVKTWYENGSQESQREMSNNSKNGLATAWYQDGSLMLIEEYDRDKIVRGEYYKKGEKIPVSLINAGKGTATLYDPDGNFLRKISYINGIPLD